MKFKVRGLDQLRKNARQAAEAIDEASTRAERMVAEDMRDDMKSRVRVDTGELRDSIRIEEAPDGLRVGPGDEQKDKALANEFGTRHMSAQPYVVPAVESARRKFPETITQEVRRSV